MKSGHPGIHLKSMVTLALPILLMTIMNSSARTAEDSVEVITYPYVVNNVNKMSPMPNGYHFELWKQPAGTVKMTIPNEEAQFTVEWSNINNFVTRVGLKFDETKKHDEIGTFTADLAFQSSGVQGNGLAYYGIYGWTVDTLRVKEDSTVEYSLVEFYVMEDWDNWRPQAGVGDHVLLGNITVDGAEYEVIKRQMQTQPSIKGTASFPQVFSIRKQPRSSGSVSISEHFKQWEKLGIKLGYLYEVKIKVESYSENNSSSGSCKVTKGVIKVNGQIPVGTVRERNVASHDNFPLFTGNNTSKACCTLVSLTGEKVRSLTLDPLKSPVFSTDNVAPGMYYLCIPGKGVAPTTRTIIVK